MSMSNTKHTNEAEQLTGGYACVCLCMRLFILPLLPRKWWKRPFGAGGGMESDTYVSSLLSLLFSLSLSVLLSPSLACVCMCVLEYAFVCTVWREVSVHTHHCKKVCKRERDDTTPVGYVSRTARQHIIAVY